MDKLQKSVILKMRNFQNKLKFNSSFEKDSIHFPMWLCLGLFQCLSSTSVNLMLKEILLLQVANVTGFETVVD